MRRNLSVLVVIPVLLGWLPGTVRAAPFQDQPSPVQERAQLGLRGWVVEQFWMAAVSGAEVVLMDESFRELDRTTSDFQGEFSFPLPEPGAYMLQARIQGLSSPPLGPLEIVAGEEPEEVVLELTSPLAASVLQCFQEEGAERTGVVLGVAEEQGSGVPLPGARIVVRWESEPEANLEEAAALTDAGGRFRVCGVPAGVPFSVEAEFMGQRSAPLEASGLQPGAIVRADLPMDLEDVSPPGGLEVAARSELESDQGVLAGRLLDATTGRPVGGAFVRAFRWVAGAGAGAEPERAEEVERADEQVQTTDRNGRFRFEEVRAGGLVLEVEHLAYGLQQVEVSLPEQAGLQLELDATPRPISLRGIEVTASRSGTEAGLRRMEFRQPRPGRTLTGERIALLDSLGTSLGAAISQLGGLIVHYGNRADQMCVQSVRMSTGMSPGGECQMITVVLDGIPVMDGAATLSDLQLSSLESIEYFSPLEAGFRYGLQASATGALVLWTRGRGPYRSPERSGGGGGDPP